jgi:hypothetical protein
MRSSEFNVPKVRDARSVMEKNYFPGMASVWRSILQLNVKSVVLQGWWILQSEIIIFLFINHLIPLLVPVAEEYLLFPAAADWRPKLLEVLSELV